MDGPELDRRITASLVEPRERADLLAYAAATRAVDREAFDDLLDAVALRAAAGSGDAVELLLELVHRLRLTAATVRARVPDRALAEDVAQQVLIRIERGIGAYGGLTRFRSWLQALARTEAAAVLRRQVAEPVAEPRAESPGRFTSVVVNRMSIEDLIAGLPAPYGETLRLQIVEDLDYEAIAARLGVPVGTVRSRLSKAKELLKQALEAARL